MSAPTMSRTNPAVWPCQTTADPDLFFRLDTASVEEAKRLCEGCPVREQCLQFAYQTNSEGIFGGMTRQERDEARKPSRTPANRPHASAA